MPLKFKRTFFRENEPLKWYQLRHLENLRGAVNTSVIVCDIVEVWSCGQKKNTPKKCPKINPVSLCEERHCFMIHLTCHGMYFLGPIGGATTQTQTPSFTSSTQQTETEWAFPNKNLSPCSRYMYNSFTISLLYTQFFLYETFQNLSLRFLRSGLGKIEPHSFLISFRSPASSVS